MIRPQFLPKAPSPDTMHWRLMQFQNMNLLGVGGRIGGKNTVHSIANINAHLKLHLHSTRSCLLRKDKK